MRCRLSKMPPNQSLTALSFSVNEFPTAQKSLLCAPFDCGKTNDMKKQARFAFGSLIVTLVLLAAFFLPGRGTAAAQPGKPKRLLVVTTTTGFRHSSIETGEKVLAQLGQQSGAFTVDYARVTPPVAPRKPTAPKAGDDAEKFKAEQEKYNAAMEGYKIADAKFKEAEKAYREEQKRVLAEKLSAASLKNYDGVIFENTTGDLPIPDKEAFLAWLRSGKAFIGTHSCSDTFDRTASFPGWPGFIDMLGGEFQTHHAQVSVDAINKDKQHPATKHLGDTFTVFDEIYIIKTYDPTKVRELLVLEVHPNTKEPGHYPIAWCKQYGDGRVFYTSFGHREDVWDPNDKNRKNSKEVSEAYQQHLLGGIKWALGLEPGSSEPQTK